MADRLGVEFTPSQLRCGAHRNSNDAERRAIRHARFEIVLSLVVESVHDRFPAQSRQPCLQALHFRAARFQSVGYRITGRAAWFT